MFENMGTTQSDREQRNNKNDEKKMNDKQRRLDKKRRRSERELGKKQQPGSGRMHEELRGKDTRNTCEECAGNAFAK